MSEKSVPQLGQKRVFALFALGLLFMVVGAYPLASMCYIVLSVRHWLAGERPKAWGVVLLSVVIATIVMASLGLGLLYGATVSLGCLLGVLIERGWTYGQRLATVVGLAFTGTATFMLVTWESMRHDMTIFMSARIAELEAQGSATEQWLDVFRWYDLNYAYFGIGSVFGSVLLMAAYVLCVVDRGHRTQEERLRRRTTAFQRMRLPDWLVWVAIVVALLWFAEHRWPNDALRVITWNAAIGLTCLYWLNGFSILLYGLATLKVPTLASVAIVSGMALFGLMHFLGLIGLFDTWYDFRLRFRRVVMLRRVAEWRSDRDM